jgi:hypothetical protein
MSDAGSLKRNFRKAGKLLSLLVVAVFCVLLLSALSIRIYLATALPAPQLSRLLTSYLHQNVTVESLHLSGGTVILKGVNLRNPEGFPQGSLAAADSVTIAPVWGDLLFGRQRFRLIALEGIRVSLDKDSRGEWNFAHLKQLLAARKPSTAETYIGELSLRNGAFRVQGQGVQGIALQVFNLSTKGSLDSRIGLAFEDAAHNSFTLSGKARAGSDAAVDLTLSAPSLQLKDLATAFKLKKPGLFEGGTGTLQVNASLHKGELVTSGDFTFSDLKIPTSDKSYTLTGALHFAGDYNNQSGTAHLQNCTLTVNDLVKFHAEGNVRNLKGDRDFALYAGMEEADLGMLNVLVSDEARKHLFIGGRLSCQALHLVGSGAKGLKSAVGTLQLRDGSLCRYDQIFVAGLFGTVGFFRKDADILAKGRFSLSGEHGKALLEALDMPFGLTLSPRLKPLWAEVPALAARVLGNSISGRLAFDAAKPDTLTASLKMPGVTLSSLNPLLKRFDLHAASGTASVSLEAAGKGPADLSLTAQLQLSELRGNRGKSPFAVKKGTIAAAVQRRGGQLQAKGEAQLSALKFSGKTADARFGYRVADGMLHLDDGQVSTGGAQISFFRLSAQIPSQKKDAKPAVYPVTLDLNGGAVKLREWTVGNLSARLRGSFNTDSAGRWLEGTADLASGAVSWQGKQVAAPAVHAALSRSGARGELSGQLLGGKAAGNFSINPFAPQAGGSFELGLSGAGLAAATPFLPKGAGLHPSGGVMELRLNGGYSRRDGFSCRFKSQGSGIALSARNGKSLISGGALSLTGALAGGNLAISEAALSPGSGVKINMKGELNQVFAPGRKGSLSFFLPETSLGTLVDPFINTLPRMVQEASFGGALAADGKIEFSEGKKLLEGALAFKSCQMVVVSQRLTVADLNGKLPFSLDLSGKGGVRQKDAPDFSRKNYPRLLEQMRRGAGGGQSITIGRIGFGALELGKLTMQLGAANGITEISSLKAPFYEGTLLGKGFVTMREKFAFRGDLLANNVSMKALCSMVPNIKGYISGRVDGVISVSGGTQGLSGITGFTNLWAREGSGEKMLVSKEFLQRLSKQKLSGFFFSSDRPYDKAEIMAMLQEGDLSFDTLKIEHTNLFGVRDLNVSIAPAQNRIAVAHLLESIKEASVRGKASTSGPKPSGKAPAEAPAAPEFKWGE